MVLSNEYFSAVFRVKDHQKFKELSSQISGAMIGGEMYGAEVTGCGWGDSMTEADALRAFIEQEGGDADEVVADFLESNK